MRIAVIPYAAKHLDNRLFTCLDERDDILASYRAIRQAAVDMGWEMETYDRLPIRQADRVLSFNFEQFPEAVLSAVEHHGRENMVAIVREPPGLSELYYDPAIQRCFGSLFLPDASRADGKHLFYLGFPVYDRPVDWIQFHEKKILISLTSFKFLDFKGSLYAERVRAIKFFQQHMTKDFDMFGVGWRKNSPYGGRFSPHRLFPCYRGSVVSKHETMRHYRFAICYENTGDVPGYVSEKIFDAMVCGCVPIYLGAPDITEYVPSGCFIDRRKFKNDSELQSFLNSISSKDYEFFLDAIRSFMGTDSFLDRTPPRYARNFIQRLGMKQAVSAEEGGCEEGKRKLRLLAVRKKAARGSWTQRKEAVAAFLRLGKWSDTASLVRIGFSSLQKQMGLFDIAVFRELKRL